MLVLVVGLAALSCVAQSRASYEEIVTQAVQIFNQGQHRQPLFRLVQTFPAPDLNITGHSLFNFQIKETVCQANQQRQPQNCAFRDNGEERLCSGAFVTHGQETRALLVRCRSERFQPGGPRVRRSAEEPTSSAYEKAKEMYERAKYEIIGNILRNF